MAVAGNKCDTPIFQNMYEGLRSDSQQWKLLHDNASAHKANFVMDYSAKHSVTVLSHPPYSPDISPCDLFYIPKLKLTLKEKRFSLSEEVIENTKAEINKLRKWTMKPL
ncbi:hypothetical protein LAZ67_20000042 [Cordylochernes scorpioides]|uniref:Transposase n=1 Tax=Cordylochernes scorpioides TaxID=51811 RepID=A0ABY6LKI2_9ARAC|nr:hypothetical protein LAZ67_20000042 [Cordylochernes scorpioides]